MALKDVIAATSSGAPHGAPALINLAGIRVLLVDDDDAQLEIVSTLLEHAKAEVVTATSAEHALRELARQAPDVIVSDISMPDCDGYHFLRRVRARAAQAGGTTPAIALTAKTATVDHSRALLAGYQVHLAKPVRVIELLVAIRKLVD